MCAIKSPTIFNSLTLNEIELSWDYMTLLSAGWLPPYVEYVGVVADKDRENL